MRRTGSRPTTGPGVSGTASGLSALQMRRSLGVSRTASGFGVSWMTRGLCVLALLAFAPSAVLAAPFASEREKKSKPFTFLQISAARYLACPDAYGEKALANWMEERSSRRFRAYTQAAEFDPAKRDALLLETRADIEAEAKREYQADRMYTVMDVEVETGKYDTERGGFWFKVPGAVGLRWTNPRPTTLQWWWYRLHQGTDLPPASIQLVPVYPVDPPLAWNDEGQLFMPVERAAAERFAAYYGGDGANNKPDGTRRALAYFDLEITGCNTKERGVNANIRGIRIYAMWRMKPEPTERVAEWAVGN